MVIRLKLYAPVYLIEWKSSKWVTNVHICISQVKSWSFVKVLHNIIFALNICIILTFSFFAFKRDVMYFASVFHTNTKLYSSCIFSQTGPPQWVDCIDGFLPKISFPKARLCTKFCFTFFCINPISPGYLYIRFYLRWRSKFAPPLSLLI